MKTHYPERLRQLPAFDGPFEAYRLSAEDADILFASYPAGTEISVHRHDTDNYGVITRGELILTVGDEVVRYGPGDWYQIPAGVEHAARFEERTEEIEFWFKPSQGAQENYEP